MSIGSTKTALTWLAYAGVGLLTAGLYMDHASALWGAESCQSLGPTDNGYRTCSVTGPMGTSSGEGWFFNGGGGTDTVMGNHISGPSFSQAFVRIDASSPVKYHPVWDSGSNDGTANTSWSHDNTYVSFCCVADDGVVPPLQ